MKRIPSQNLVVNECESPVYSVSADSASNNAFKTKEFKHMHEKQDQIHPSPTPPTIKRSSIRIPKTYNALQKEPIAMANKKLFVDTNDTLLRSPSPALNDSNIKHSELLKHQIISQQTHKSSTFLDCNKYKCKYDSENNYISSHIRQRKRHSIKVSTNHCSNFERNIEKYTSAVNTNIKLDENVQQCKNSLKQNLLLSNPQKNSPLQRSPPKDGNLNKILKKRQKYMLQMEKMKRSQKPQKNVHQNMRNNSSQTIGINYCLLLLFFVVLYLMYKFIFIVTCDFSSYDYT